MRPVCDWTAIDWRKPNAQIAVETGAAITTVIKRRTTHGHPSDATWTRPDLAALNRRPERREQTRRVQPLATAAAQRSPLAGKGISNVHAVDWVIVSPQGDVHRVRNLYQWVRDNPELFAEADRTWKRAGGKRGTGGEYCNVTNGLNCIRSGYAKSWKGWRLGG